MLGTTAEHRYVVSESWFACFHHQQVHLQLARPPYQVENKLPLKVVLSGTYKMPLDDARLPFFGEFPFS